jgi:hypothetical protein
MSAADIDRVVQEAFFHAGAAATRSPVSEWLARLRR